MGGLESARYTDTGELREPLRELRVRGFLEGWKELELPPPPGNETETTLWELERIRGYLGPGGEYERRREEIERQDRSEDDPTDFTTPGVIEEEFWALLEPVYRVGVEEQVRVSRLAGELTAIGTYYKRKYDRVRPYQLAALMGRPLGTMRSETAYSAAYPSNHALIGTFLGRYLGEKYPLHRPLLERLGRELGNNRVYAGLHFPSDVIAGRKLAGMLWPLLVR